MDRKIIGSFIGSAIGDGFGYPTEFLSLEEIKTKWGENGLEEPEGEKIKVTDDTQMAISLSKAIMRSYEENDMPPKTYEKALREEFVIWLNDKENNRAPGMTCLESCERLERGINWEEATAKNSKGCGANMRVLPIGLLKFKDGKITNTQISKWAQFQSAITHGHPTALVASELTAMTIIKLIEGLEVSELIPRLLDHCNSQKDIYHEDYLGRIWQRPGIENSSQFINRGWDECIDILNKVNEALQLEDEIKDPCNFTGEGWIAEESFGTALLCFLLYPDDSRKSLIRAVNTKGDSDSIACLTGGFSGAKNGIESFPIEWVERIEYQLEMKEYIDFVLNK